MSIVHGSKPTVLDIDPEWLARFNDLQPSKSVNKYTKHDALIWEMLHVRKVNQEAFAKRLGEQTNGECSCKSVIQKRLCEMRKNTPPGPAA